MTEATATKLLTEKQILADSKKNYMNQNQAAFFKDRLIQLYQATEKHIEQVRFALSDEERNTDESDRASQEEERSLQLKIIDRELKLLKKISYSLKQIENGEYGYCEETGEPIGIPRLLLRPTATMSVDAKSILEEKEKEFNDDISENSE